MSSINSGSNGLPPLSLRLTKSFAREQSHVRNAKNALKSAPNSAKAQANLLSAEARLESAYKQERNAMHKGGRRSRHKRKTYRKHKTYRKRR